MKKKIVVFTGAGLDKESGINTFRDSVDGLWENYSIDDVCTPSGWKKDREKVLNFYNERRRQLPTVQPNQAHFDLVKLEDKYDVTIITQNVSDLHERAGSSKVLHLHGELTKARSSLYDPKKTLLDTIIDIGYDDINIGDTCEITDSQLRPHIVWFEEYPFNVEESYQSIGDTDILIIVGTSLNITYTIQLLANICEECKIYYVDPNPNKILSSYGLNITYIEKPATEGVELILNELL